MNDRIGYTFECGHLKYFKMLTTYIFIALLLVHSAREKVFHPDAQ